MVAPVGVTSAPLASPLVGSAVMPKTAGLPPLSKPRTLLARSVVGGRQKSMPASAGWPRSARPSSSRSSWISSMMRSSSALIAAARNGPPSTNSVSRMPSVRRSNVIVLPGAGGTPNSTSPPSGSPMPVMRESGRLLLPHEHQQIVAGEHRKRESEARTAAVAGVLDERLGIATEGVRHGHAASLEWTKRRLDQKSSRERRLKPPPNAPSVLRVASPARSSRLRSRA